MIGKRKGKKTKKKVFRTKKKLKLPQKYFYGDPHSSEGEVSEWLPDEENMDEEVEKKLE